MCLGPNRAGGSGHNKEKDEDEDESGNGNGIGNDFLVSCLVLSAFSLSFFLFFFLLIYIPFVLAIVAVGCVRLHYSSKGT